MLYYSMVYFRESKCDDVEWYKRKRYYVILLLFWNDFIAMMQLLNLSIALVEMTSSEKFTNESGTYYIRVSVGMYVIS